MSRTMTSRPICTPCAGSGIEALAFWVDDEEVEDEQDRHASDESGKEGPVGDG